MGCYRNAMEVLVEQEVEVQMKRLPPKVAAYINRLELVAFALNHLPSLYATSERGLDHQLKRGAAKYSVQVTQAVQRALVAVRRDPIRNYAPLQHPSPPMMQDVLRQLKTLLNNDSVNWDTLPISIERALTAAKRDGRISATSGGASSSLSPVAPLPQSLGAGSRHSGVSSTGMTAAQSMTSAGTAANRLPSGGMSSTGTPSHAEAQGRSPLLRQYSVVPRKDIPPAPPTSAPTSSGTEYPASPTRPSRTVHDYPTQPSPQRNSSQSDVYGWDDPFYRH